jgi:hypothetical protein
MQEDLNKSLISLLNPLATMPPSFYYNEKRDNNLEDCTFKILLDKRPGDNLGLEVRDTYLYFSSISEGCLVSKWNDANPDCAVRPGDRIVQVNSVYNDHKKMISECGSADLLEIMVHRKASLELFGSMVAPPSGAPWKSPSLQQLDMDKWVEQLEGIFDTDGSVKYGVRVRNEKVRYGNLVLSPQQLLEANGIADAGSLSRRPTSLIEESSAADAIGKKPSKYTIQVDNCTDGCPFSGQSADGGATDSSYRDSVLGEISRVGRAAMSSGLLRGGEKGAASAAAVAPAAATIGQSSPDRAGSPDSVSEQQVSRSGSRTALIGFASAVCSGTPCAPPSGLGRSPAAGGRQRYDAV